MAEDVFEAEGPVAVITLNRPAQLNAISSESGEGAGRSLAALRAGQFLKVAVLTGSGRRPFAPAWI